ncbi:SDR family oxidoreductase [Aminobacter carboxidus]|uniref:SDR family NAD(P)-dependent oxidoreductase n=1 Tax=Aminobacter carboxidus TaxID=376165 RepID=A0ABR9GVJ0_9HYPH|nr:SDR family NAD(P)-dependent oxidoreductase [Aminobacter carboxidus]MBE1207703.1 SDR family NAD(P)-dependent oxidoreductase [Aminobacter carboxidus]
MRHSFDFNNKTVLVTGGARGIGLELSRQLVSKGAHVIAIGRDAASLDALAMQFHGSVTIMQADLGTPGSARALSQWVRETRPECSVLINNAAIMHHTDLTVDSPARLAAISAEITVNLTAPLQLSVAMLPVLSAHPAPAIVNITSGLAIAPKREAAVYCASKAALRSFTRSLRDQCRASKLPIQVSEAVMTLVDTTLSRAGSFRKYPPVRAAADLIAGVERGLDEIWIEKTKLLRIVHRLSPELAYRIMRDR